MNHIGAFAVKDSDVNNYITRFNPVLLRSKVTSGKKYAIESLQKFTYGKAKGLGFDRVLILPTKEYISFLCGERDVFNDQKTESSKNKLYVALTRARYSVAIIYPDVIPKNCPLKIWTPE
ncbi:TPA: 3'-5' exonuclease [Escherichia coli]